MMYLLNLLSVYRNVCQIAHYPIFIVHQKGKMKCINEWINKSMLHLYEQGRVFMKKHCISKKYKYRDPCKNGEAQARQVVEQTIRPH